MTVNRWRIPWVPPQVKPPGLLRKCRVDIHRPYCSIVVSPIETPLTMYFNRGALTMTSRRKSRRAADPKLRTNSDEQADPLCVTTVPPPPTTSRVRSEDPCACCM